MEKLYDVNWKCDHEDNIADVSVDTVTVTRRGILPGCSAETISVRYPDGTVYNANPAMFFKAEQEAWRQAMYELRTGIEQQDRDIAARVVRRAAAMDLLVRLEKEHQCRDTSV